MDHVTRVIVVANNTFHGALIRHDETMASGHRNLHWAPRLSPSASGMTVLVKTSHLETGLQQYRLNLTQYEEKNQSQSNLRTGGP